jgi:large subunit ribosomal protein L13e
VKHNNVLPNVHYRKEWDLRVKTWLDQPMRKTRRRIARKAKAAKAFPRPVDALRPIVRGQTVRYNTKQRVGRGFTLEELKAAGLTQNRARQVGIAVDFRRTNKSNESVEINSKRLKDYVASLVIVGCVQRLAVFPRRGLSLVGVSDRAFTAVFLPPPSSSQCQREVNPLQALR